VGGNSQKKKKKDEYKYLIIQHESVEKYITAVAMSIGINITLDIRPVSF
jgi:hypothetical protein